MNRRQWVAVWEFNRSQTFLEDKTSDAAAMKLAVRVPLAIVPPGKAR